MSSGTGDKIMIDPVSYTHLNYYYSVARGESFRKRFTEMAVLSFSVAGISFLIGYALKTFTGIDA